MARIVPFLAAFLLVLSIASAFAGEASATLSPFNSRRPAIPKSQIKFIVLHTTEGLYPGCLEKLKRYGEAHFLVRLNGQVIRIMDLNRVAKHAGRSMWNKLVGLDHHGIGIEVEGYHHTPPNLAQAAALRELIADLQYRFGIRDENVVTHSMVAYGPPNRWYDKHRGRKRCGMMMARADVRSELGLGRAAAEDPDVSASRLQVGDEPLFAFLFNPQTDVHVFGSSRQRVREYLAPLRIPSKSLVGGAVVPLKSGSRPMTVPKARTPVPLPGRKPQPPPISPSPLDLLEVDDEDVSFKEIGVDGTTAYAIAKTQYASTTTIYFFSNGWIRTGKELAASHPDLLARLPKGTKVLVGHVYGGKVTADRSAFHITKQYWSDPSTIYRFPDKSLKTGDEVTAGRIPVGTVVLFQR